MPSEYLLMRVMPVSTWRKRGRFRSARRAYVLLSWLESS
jgi:hypothetical protein